MAVIDGGSSTAGKANVDADYQLAVATNADPTKAGAARIFSENDPGDVTGEAYCYSPETDEDYRLRVAQDAMLAQDTFCYTAQNTGTTRYANTTMTATWNAGGLLTNASGITTTTTGVEVGTYAEYPIIGAAGLNLEFTVSFSAAPVANTTVDIGLFRRAGSNPYAPTDGVYLRLNSSGLFGVINHNGSETTTSVFAALDGGSPYQLNRVYQVILVVTEREVQFWIDNVLYATLNTPAAQGQPCMSATLPFSLRHAIAGGAAGGVLQVTLRDFNVTLAGTQVANELATVTSRAVGTHQGLNGGTMGSLANYANSANPTAAVPTNTTAALGSGLGGQFWETDTLAVTTDGVISSFQVPAATVNVAGKRLVIYGVTISSYVQTVLVGGGYVAQWSLAFGHTAVSLATSEAATTKAPRRVPLGIQAVGADAAVSTVLSTVQQQFGNPIYVNPGEFVQTVKKKVGTAPSSGVIAHVVTFDYGWE